MSAGAVRAVRRFGIALFVLVALAAGAALWLLGTESGTRFSVRTFLKYYNDMIPGEIVAEEISGTLFERLTLRGVALSDREREPIVTAEILRAGGGPRRHSHGRSSGAHGL